MSNCVIALKNDASFIEQGLKMMNNSEDIDPGAIMASLDPEENHHRSSPTAAIQTKSLPDVLSTELQSLNLLADHDNNRLSFLLLDGDDNVTVQDFAEFCRKLGCDPSVRDAKVVSIVGNTGDGKSYALNQIFFPRDQQEHADDDPLACISLIVWSR